MKRKFAVGILIVFAFTAGAELVFGQDKPAQAPAAVAEPPKPGEPVSAAATPPPAAPAPPKVDTGDTAWMLTSAALVLLMTPGLALFYGGMVRAKNVLGTIMHSFIIIAVISVQWVLFGYSLAFGPDRGESSAISRGSD